MADPLGPSYLIVSTIGQNVTLQPVSTKIRLWFGFTFAKKPQGRCKFNPSGEHVLNLSEIDSKMAGETVERHGRGHSGQVLDLQQL